MVERSLRVFPGQKDELYIQAIYLSLILRASRAMWDAILDVDCALLVEQKPSVHHRRLFVQRKVPKLGVNVDVVEKMIAMHATKVRTFTEHAESCDEHFGKPSPGKSALFDLASKVAMFVRFE
ncbi:hypothetical protein FVE85_4705 [Porphyridium purpureum]|uniref:Uncharacterized protein n=1 Tax=Porphyridium purpureum TaxID=35688 RepID=A0A5J4YQH1_PORPP|nr:hypothetical protein FVE85_4705 [Porphyridium purpureum]|eukprot:POR5455..scf236_6